MLWFIKWEEYLQFIYLIRNLYSGYIKISHKLTTKTKNPINKWETNLNRHFSKKDIQMTSMHKKGGLTLLL